MLLTLALALGCGLLVGIEREHRKGHGPRRAFGGVRTFALAAVAGALCMLLGELVRPAWPPAGSGLLVVAGALVIGGLGVASHARERVRDPGVTTEVALLLTYLIGAVAVWHGPLAAGMAAVLAFTLALRRPLHRLSAHWLQHEEMRDLLTLAVFALVALPLAPDVPLWGPVLNPHVLIRLFVLLLAIQALGHLAGRLMARGGAVMLSALVAGAVSSTAFVATQGVAVRQQRLPARAAASGALLSCVVTLPQLLLVCATVRPAWLGVLWMPVAAGSVTAGLAGWLLGRKAAPADAASSALTEDAPQAPPARLIRLRDAALVAALLAGVQVAVHALTLLLGPAGMVAGTLVAALVDIHAASAALLSQAPGTPQSQPLVLLALVLAVGLHTGNKAVVGAVSGGRAYALALAPGLLAHWLAFAAALALVWWV